MNDKKKHSYINFLMQTICREILRYDISESQKKFLKEFTTKLTASDDLLRDLYLLAHVKNFKNIGRYLIFVTKKLEENVINFDNLLFNAEKDKAYLKNELLINFSNPELKNIPLEDENTDTAEDYTSFEKNNESIEREFEEETAEIETEDNDDEEFSSIDEESEEYTGSGKYLELIRSEEQSEIVFELPVSGEENETAFELPEKTVDEDSEYINKSEEEKEGSDIDRIDSGEDKGGTIADSIEGEKQFSAEDKEKILKETESVTDSTEDEEIKIKYFEENFSERESSFRIVSTIDGKATGKTNETETERDITEAGKAEIVGAEKSDIKEEDEPGINLNEAKTSEEEKDEVFSADENSERIELSEEIQEELKNADEKQDEAEIEEDNEISEIMEEGAEDEAPVTNAEFIEFEKEIEAKNNLLKNDFDIMIYLVKAKPGDEGERESLISSIMETTEQMEIKSRKMALEIISNVYQTINLSFEKIADGKYDISEGTLSLFKKGLDFIMGMIRGDNYFEYKDVFKSTENIRKKLTAEKQKREEFRRKATEKEEIEKKLSSKFPDEIQRAKLAELKKLITDTESKFNMIEKISGDYKTYEALRSLSLCLINFKEIVGLSNDLGLNTLSKLSESGYIFLKFLQSYRINPDTDEIRQTNRYIIKCMKALFMDKTPDDMEKFISYLNDPVKIIAKKPEDKY